MTSLAELVRVMGGVIGCSHGPEVLWVHALLDVARVMKLNPVGDLSDQLHPYDPVSRFAVVMLPLKRSSIPIEESTAGPPPTPIGSDLNPASEIRAQILRVHPSTSAKAAARIRQESQTPHNVLPIGW